MEKKEYTFVRIRNKNEKNSNGSWYLLGDSIETIKEHFNTYGKAYFKEGVDDFIAWLDRGKVGHYKSKFAYLIDITSQLRNKPWIIVATELENEILRSRLNCYFKEETQYLGREMAVLIDNPLIEILETRVKNELVYPDDEKLSLADVRYLQWNYGKHWYAKIGKFDIIDEYNNQKWNTKEEAEEAAKWYIDNSENDLQIYD